MSHEHQSRENQQLGKAISYDEARKSILESEIFGVDREAFLQVFEEEVDPKSRVAVFNDAQWNPYWSSQGHYLIGKSTTNQQATLTFETVSTYFNLVGGEIHMQIGLDYAIPPLSLMTPEEFEAIRSREEEGLELYEKAFPLLYSKHGARISARGLNKRNPLGVQLTGRVEDLQKEITDKRLETVTNRLHSALLALRQNT